MIRQVLLVLSLVLAIPAFAAAPKNGEAAPDFTLKGADGKDYKLSQFKGKTVVLEWFNNDCPYVKKYYDSKKMQDLQKQVVAKGDVWLTIASSASGKEGHLDAKAAQKLYKERDMGSTAILLDSKGEVGKKIYEAKTTPHMFVINKEGLLAYQGAIDDKPSASAKSLEGAQNYVSLAIAALEKKEQPKTASTTPYGCSIKYQ